MQAGSVGACKMKGVRVLERRGRRRRWLTAVAPIRPLGAPVRSEPWQERPVPSRGLGSCAANLGLLGPSMHSAPSHSAPHGSAWLISFPSGNLLYGPFFTSTAKMMLARAAWAWYSRLLDTRPVLSRVLSTVPVLVAADAVSQSMEEGPWNWRKTIGMGLHGAIWVGPVSYNWYRFLAHTIPIKPPVLPRLCATVAIDSVFMSPLFIMAFFTTRGLIEHQSAEQIKTKIKNETFHVWTMGCAYWIPVAFLNFYVIPLKYRVIAMNGFSFLWNSYLVARTQYEKSHHQPASELSKAEIKL